MSTVRANASEMLDGRGKGAIVFDTLQDLKDSTVIAVGQRVQTLGYISLGDGGGNDYEIVAAGTGADDGGAFIDLAGSGLQAKGLFNDGARLRQWGPVGDGVADDTSFCKAAFSSGLPLRDLTGGKYRIVSDTLTANHPFQFIGRGEGVTEFVFEDMGGFSGIDGIFIDVPEDAEFGASSFFAAFSVVVKNDHGRHGISTKRELQSTTNVWVMNRPKYTFDSVQMKGDDQTGGGSNPRYAEGWARYFDLGDSRDSSFTHCNIFGCFDDTVDPSNSPSLETKETVGWFFGGLDDENGGAVFMPQVQHCSTHFVGKNIAFGRRVSNPRIVDSQFHRSGYGIFDDKVWLGTAFPGTSEMQIGRLNINAMFGGVRLSDTDFFTAHDIRCTRSSETFDHPDAWVGLNVANEARQITANTIRAFYSQPVGDYSNSRHGIVIKGGGVVDINDVFLRHDGGGAFSRGVFLDDCVKASVDGVKNTGAVTNLISVEGASVTTPDLLMSKISATSQVTTKYSFQTGLDLRNVRYDEFDVYDGISGISTINASGTTTVDPKRGAQLRRFAFAAGTAGAYTHNLKAVDEGRDGDILVIWFQVNLSSGTDPTINIVDNTDATVFTVTGTSEFKTYKIEMVFQNGAWRLIQAIRNE